VTAYTVDRVVGPNRGLNKGTTILGLEWAMRSFETTPAAARAAGQRYELQLVPWTSINADGKLGREQMFDDTQIVDAPLYWVLSAKRLGRGD